MPPGRYVCPGHFSRHVATILGFPSGHSLPSQFYGPACCEIAGLAAAVSEFEPVRLYAQPGDLAMVQRVVRKATRRSHGNIQNITFIPLGTHHLWVRDTGPVYVRAENGANQKSRFAIDFNFTEWGHKNEMPSKEDLEWPDLDEMQLQDNTNFAKNVLESDTDPTPVVRIETKLCLEGGALVVDGEGTLLATESSILNSNRNPRLTRSEIESELRQKLGAEKIIWFPGKVGLDVTDVHIDAEVNFLRPGVVLLSRPHVTAPNEWWQVHNEIVAILKQSTDAKGRNFAIHIVEEPDPSCLDVTVDNAPATNYVNFYFTNGGLILPHFGDVAADKAALELLQKLCPDRVVRPVQVRTLPLLGGVIHCATQQVIDVTAE